MIGYMIFTGAMAVAIMCISYDSMARAKGWPVGEILAQDAGLPKILAFVTAGWVLVKSFMVFSWWSPFAILVAGWLLAFVVTNELQKNTQFLCLAGVVPAMVLVVLYMSEDKPFGMLHKIFG